MAAARESLARLQRDRLPVRGDPGIPLQTVEDMRTGLPGFAPGGHHRKRTVDDHHENRDGGQRPDPMTERVDRVDVAGPVRRTEGLARDKQPVVDPGVREVAVQGEGLARGGR